MPLKVTDSHRGWSGEAVWGSTAMVYSIQIYVRKDGRIAKAYTMQNALYQCLPTVICVSAINPSKNLSETRKSILFFFYLIDFLRKCVLKHSLLEISPMRCYKRNWYLTDTSPILMTIAPSQVLVLPSETTLFLSPPKYVKSRAHTTKHQF